MRVLLLADTHGVLDARIAELAQDCALAVHAGDVGASAVLDALTAAAGRVLAVRGNNDAPGKWHGSPAELAALPATLAVPLPGGVLAVDHGDAYPAARRSARLCAVHTDARAVVCGHSHRLLQDLAATPWILNPGAAGQARTGDGPSCLLLEASAEHWRVTAFRWAPAPRRRGKSRHTVRR
jgi:putative phosphoesterase